MKREIGDEVVKRNEWCHAPSSDIYPEITSEGERWKAVSSQYTPEVVLVQFSMRRGQEMVARKIWNAVAGELITG
jgi:hypothetical protein